MKQKPFDMETAMEIAHQQMLFSDQFISNYAMFLEKFDNDSLISGDIRNAVDFFETEIDRLEKAYSEGCFADYSLETARFFLKNGLRKILDALPNKTIPFNEESEQRAYTLLRTRFAPRILERGNHKFTQDWFEYHANAWRRMFGGLASQSHLRILEVGAYEGRSSCWILDNILTRGMGVLVVVDNFKDRQVEQRFDYNISVSNKAHNVVKLKGNSQDILKQLERNVFDLIYIDGSHDAMDVFQDAVLSLELLKVNGFLVFDDYGNFLLNDLFYSKGLHRKFYQEPKESIDYFTKANRSRFFVISKGWQVVLRKKG